MIALRGVGERHTLLSAWRHHVYFGPWSDWNSYERPDAEMLLLSDRARTEEADTD